MEAQIAEIENKKRQEFERMKRELENKYKEEEMFLRREEQSNSNELKKILLEKAQQIKTVTENHNKTKADLEFYKNRNKELEGVVARSEKSFKEQLSALEKELKVNKEVIAVLDRKISEINLAKMEIETKCKDEVEKLSARISEMKRKEKEQKTEEKLSLIKKSMAEFDESLKAIFNSLCCNYCMEPAKDCVRVEKCGHIYCKKCSEGYQPNCGECNAVGDVRSDKIIDSTVSKTEYMVILLKTVKEDIGKIWVW